MTFVYWKIIGAERFKARLMIIYGGRYIYKSHADTTRLNAFYHRGIAYLITDICIVLSLNIVSYSIVGIQFLVMLIIFGERVNVVGMILPFTDDTTDRGYYLNLAFQIACFAYALCGNFSTECVACMVNNKIVTMAEFICLKVEDLNEILDSIEPMNANEKSLQRLEIKTRIRDIFIYSQDFDRFAIVFRCCY